MSQSGQKSKHKAREFALQWLYELDVQRVPSETEIVLRTSTMSDEQPLQETVAAYAHALVAGVWSQRAKYDRMISEVSDHWEVSRMAVVDRNILRMALYELVERPDVPPRVVIDEAIELGREYGDAETPHFINGVLDATWKRHPICRVARGEPDAERSGGGRGIGAVEASNGTV